MKKLEEIGKKDIFNVPDGYFESLPTIIQSRVAKKEPSWIIGTVGALKYALPVLAIAVSALWFFKPEPVRGPEEMLASINSEDIADYINSMEINNDDLLELIDYTQINADSLDLQEADILLDDEIDWNDVTLDIETEI